jgi:hypothetical protein
MMRRLEQAISACGWALELDLAYPWVHRWFGEAPLRRHMCFGLPSLLTVNENGDATSTFRVRFREANAVVRHSPSRNSPVNLHKGKDVTVFGQCGGIFTSDDGHILEPFTGFCIYYAK